MAQSVCKSWILIDGFSLWRLPDVGAVQSPPDRRGYVLQAIVLKDYCGLSTGRNAKLLTSSYCAGFGAHVSRTTRLSIQEWAGGCVTHASRVLFFGTSLKQLEIEPLIYSVTSQLAMPVLHLDILVSLEKLIKRGFVSSFKDGLL